MNPQTWTGWIAAAAGAVLALFLGILALLLRRPSLREPPPPVTVTRDLEEGLREERVEEVVVEGEEAGREIVAALEVDDVSERNRRLIEAGLRK